jgi:putative transposase
MILTFPGTAARPCGQNELFGGYLGHLRDQLQGSNSNRNSQSALLSRSVSILYEFLVYGGLLCHIRTKRRGAPTSVNISGASESFNGKLRDELLNGEIFYTLKEAQILIERWRREYNTVRPHSALGYRPPAPEAIQVMPRDPGSAMLRQDLWADLATTLT